MLIALRGVEGVTYRNPSPCTGTSGPVQYQLDMLIFEATQPNSEATLEITNACLQRYPELKAPFDVASEIHIKNGLPGDCQE